MKTGYAPEESRTTRIAGPFPGQTPLSCPRGRPDVCIKWPGKTVRMYFPTMTPDSTTLKNPAKSGFSEKPGRPTPKPFCSKISVNIPGKGKNFACRRDFPTHAFLSLIGAGRATTSFLFTAARLWQAPLKPPKNLKGPDSGDFSCSPISPRKTAFSGLLLSIKK